jgi:hypothetical protein
MPKPEENLWLEILKCSPQLKGLLEEQIRLKLREGNFPEDLIERFLRGRRMAPPVPKNSMSWYFETLEEDQLDVEFMIELTEPGNLEALTKDAVETLSGSHARRDRRIALFIEALQNRIETAKKILTDGLKYYEHDGRDMPKRVSREALEALGIPEKDQRA